ncbi:hypothetical protein Tco_0700318 [Tanacetum coccineum]
MARERHTIEKQKKLTTLPLERTYWKLEVYEEVIKKDFETSKSKRTNYILFAIKVKKAVGWMMKIAKLRSEDKRMLWLNNDQKAFIGGAWSDNGEDEVEKTKDKTCLVAQAPDEICLGINLEPDEWIKDSGCSKHMTGNSKIVFFIESIQRRRKGYVEDVPVTEEKVEVVKKEEPIKRTGKRKKQKARKGTHADKTAKHEAEEDMEALVKGNPVSAIPVAIKPPSIANWKIIKLGNKGVYQIIREDGTYITYINFGAMLKSISRDDLTELYRLVMQKYGTNGPEDEYERVFWGDLKTMFDPPLSTDPVWNLPYQQKMLRWRYYDTCRVHCLTLESADIYMLTERRYPIPADVCQAMLDKKLQGDKKDEACYQFCNGVEKDCLSVGLATTQQMVISSPCLTDIKNWLVQSKRLWGGLLGIKYSRLNSVSNTVSSASTHVSTGRRVTMDPTYDELMMTVTTLEGTVSTLTKTVLSLQGTIGTLVSRLLMLEGTIDTLESRLLALEGDAREFGVVSDGDIPAYMSPGQSYTSQGPSYMSPAPTTPKSILLANRRKLQSRRTLLRFNSSMIAYKRKCMRSTIPPPASTTTAPVTTMSVPMTMTPLMMTTEDEENIEKGLKFLAYDEGRMEGVDGRIRECYLDCLRKGMRCETVFWDLLFLGNVDGGKLKGYHSGSNVKEIQCMETASQFLLMLSKLEGDDVAIFSDVVIVANLKKPIEDSAG